MKYFGKDEISVKGECESCGKMLKIDNQKVSETAEGFKIYPPAACTCGEIHETIYRKGTAIQPNKQAIKDKWQPCPRCGSNRVIILSIMHYWWEMIKMWIGGILVAIMVGLIFPPAGLIVLGVFIVCGIAMQFGGIFNPRLKCLDCKKEWKYDPQLEDIEARA